MSELNDDMWEQIELNNYGKGKLIHIVNEQAELIRVMHDQLQQAHRDATEEVAKAHKRGWEQCQRECMDKILDSAMPYISIQPSFTYRGIANMIAAMEYKEKANE